MAFSTTPKELQAMLGYLPAWLAGLGMACSSLGVVLNAMRLSKALQFDVKGRA